jgi:hypothetical protein
MSYHRRVLAAAALGLTTTLPAAASGTPAQKCEAAAASGLAACVQKVGSRARGCYLDTGHACPPGDPGVAGALSKLQAKVTANCPDAPTVQAAGYGAVATPAGLIARLKESCQGEPASIAARTFGGPQGALLVGAAADLKSCMGTGALESVKVVKKELKIDSACIRKAHKGDTCNLPKTAAKIAAVEGKASTKVGVACADLKGLVGLDVPTYVGRAAAQARCAAATAHGGSGPLALDCGPRPEVTVPAPGTWVQVVLPEATWGTRCGDGSSYAFWLKLAPTGSPPERIVVDLQGGGVCIAESDCAGVNPSLFSATDDGQPDGGYMSTDPTINPFADWTQIFLPYCTQDVHIGGGLQSVFPSITVNRFGAINVRASLRYLRDALWQVLAATDPEGYSPDRLTVLFGGESAGGFGVSYNYHYLLDDLRWVHTTAVPDAGLGMDNGGGVGVKTLGMLIESETPPLGWGTRPFQPPYCLATDCAVIDPILNEATTPRLKAFPEQQVLTVSNQVDDTQINTTFFPDAPSWINALRTTYCEQQGLNGLHFWYPAVSTPYHTILRTTSRFTTVTADGVTVRDWLADAMANPATVQDRVDEGTLVTDYPGTNPFGCPVNSPSGAFLD